MTIQQHASFDSSAAELNATSKLVKAWESKNAKNAAKAGGVSLMALSLAACGGSDDVAVDITSDNAEILLAAVTAVDATATTVAEVAANANAAGVTAGETAADAAIRQSVADAGITVAADATSAEMIAAVAASDNATVTAEAKTAALTDAAGTKTYTTVDAAYDEGVLVTSADAVTAALTDADGTPHATVDAAITSNDTAIADAATTAADATAEARLVAGTGFDTVAALNAEYLSAIAATPTLDDEPLTTAVNDVVTGTAGNDTIVASATTFQTGDIIVDSSTSDSDTLTVSLTAANAALPTVFGIENVIFNVSSFTDIDLDADGIRGGEITVNQTQANGGLNATVDDVIGSSGTIVTSGSGVTGTLTVNADSGGLTVNGGLATTVVVTTANAGTNAATTIAGANATTYTIDGIDADGTTITSSKAGVLAAQVAVNLDGSTAATDAVTISANGFVDLDGETTGGDDVEIYDLSGNGAAATYTFNGDETVEQITFSGSEDVTVSGTAAQFTAEKFIDSNSGVTTLDITTAGVLDIDTDAAIDVLNLGVDMAGAQIDIASGQVINVEVTEGTGLDINSATASAATNAVTITVDDKLAADNDIDFGTVDITNVKTVNIDLSAGDNLLSSAGSYGAATDVTITGSGDATVVGTAGTVTATGMTGVLSATMAATLKTATGGEGNDIFTGYAGDFTIDGGAGTNTLNLAATTDMGSSTVSLANIDLIQLDSATPGSDTVTFKGSALDDFTTVVKGTGAANDTLSILMDETSFNGANLTVDVASAVVSFDLTGVATLATTIVGTTGVDSVANEGTGAVTINAGKGNDTVDVAGGVAAHKVYGEAGDDTLTGGAGAETLSGGDGADLINAGAGANIISGGEGIDAIAGGADVDTVDLSETTSAADSFTYTAQGEGSAAGTAGGTWSGFDVVTGFVAGTDTVRFDSNHSDGIADVDALATAVTAKNVLASTAATNNALDLADADYTDVDKVVSFLADAHTTVASQLDVMAITFSNFTAVYILDNAGADTVAAATDLELLGTFDAVLTTADLIIA